MKKHKIISVASNSIAWEMDLEPSDLLISINGQEVKDILDYRWLMAEETLLVEVQKPSGEVWELEIEKDSDEDLGLSFAPGSMGEDKRCANACIFCFVDQQPPGLRKSLYVKDDDFYQSFSLGNYITLTNLSDEDIQQIIKYRLSPMRISVHAADMELRQTMMGNRKAGELMDVLTRFAGAGIDMHFQVVLCKGVNDGWQLDHTIKMLDDLGRPARSLAIVPVGLTKYRDGLYPLEAFSTEDAISIIAEIETWQRILLKLRGRRFVFLSDEWYVLANRELPGHDYYEDFPQLDNGVGMMALFEKEFLGELELKRMMAYDLDDDGKRMPSYVLDDQPPTGEHCPQLLISPLLKLNFIRIGIVTGQAAGVFMKTLAKHFTDFFPNTTMDIHVVRNDFYGGGVTVSGLLTGRDIIRQLKGQCDGIDVLFIPENAFRANSEDMLCGTTLEEVAQALGITVIKGSADGGEFCRQLIHTFYKHINF